MSKRWIGIEYIRWVTYVSVPVIFGYGLASREDVLDWVKRTFPSEALNPRGDHGQKLSTLQDEYERLMVEEAVDNALEKLRKPKQASK